MYRLLFFSIALLFFVSCENKSLPPVIDLVEKPEEIDPHVTTFIKKTVQHKSKNGTRQTAIDTLQAAPVIKNIYEQNNFNPLWSSNGVFNYRFYTFFNILKNARYYYGLVPDDYCVHKIDTLIRTVYDAQSLRADAVKIGQADILTTNAFIVMYNHLRNGRIEIDSMIRKVWKPGNSKINYDSLLLSSIKNNSFYAVFDSLEPKYEQYHLLKRMLRSYIDSTSKFRWTSMPDINKDTATYMNAVKKRMIEMGYYDSLSKGNDSVKLAKALKKFQKAYRLTEDGKIGKEMIKALNYTVEKRIRQIELTMERWRIEQPITFEKYIWVNIPGFYLRVAEADSLVMESKIVVGDYKHHTPELKSKIINILVYPYWNVPKGIAVKEILPRIKWDTGYLAKGNYEVINWKGQIVDHRKINWKKYNRENLPYRFRQRMGEDNSLGVMKFNFYNKYDVFIHDTNNKKAFKKEVRALSHGCMRIEDYFEFAKFLIRDDSLRYKPDSLLAYIQREEQKKINLKEHIRLYVRYYTVEAKNMELLFYPDIYDRDEELMKYLYRKPL